MNSLEIDCAAVKQKLDAAEEFLLLDCREQEEYDIVRLPDSKLVPMSVLQERFDELKSYRQMDVVVLCHHGMRSLQVAAWLKQQGFASVLSMSGGIDEWARTIAPGMTRY